MDENTDPSGVAHHYADQTDESDDRGGNHNLAEGVQDVDGYPVNEDDGLYPQVVEGDYEEEDSISGGANEEDEAINLADILSARDSCLTEEELWALCRECCLVLEVVNSSPEMFQTLCITPDTVAFDTVGNVCFLDLGSAPEPLYIPPEYNNEGNSYKSHLFSLGMTLLYAAEYNTDQEQTELNPELHDLLGCMTSEKVENRPDLENVITQCEEELVGKSSQDVCASIGQFVAVYSPAPPDLSCVSLADVTESLAEYLQTQSSLISDSRPDEHSDIKLVNPQEHSTPLLPSKHKHHQHTEDSEQSGDMPAIGLHTGIPQPTGNRGVPSRPSPRKTPRGGSVSSNTQDFVYNNNNNEVQKAKPPVPRKPDSFRSKEKRSEDDSGFMADTGNLSEIDTPTKHNKSHDTSMVQHQHDSPSTASVNSAMDDSVGNSEYRAKRSKRRQGVTICEILDVVDRYLGEEELWALLKEGNIALKRKRKHLPAYISPDTLLLRENGTLSFKAIPDNKPLETMFMSPELQQKGQLTEKTCLFGLAVTMKCAGGNKHSTSMEELNMSGDLTTLLTSMVDLDPMCRPTFDEVSELVGEQERDMGGSFINTNQLLFQEAYIKLLDHPIPEIPKEAPPKIMESPKDENANMSDGSAFRSVNGSLINPSSSFKPIVPGKLETESSLPSAFVSSATHFKPIVIHQSNSPEKGTKALTNTTSSVDNDTSEKDKEVVRKLKELKQNLMKHRQSELKSNENDEKSSNSKPSQDGAIKKPVPAARLKPAKSHENLHDKMSSNSDSKSESGGALESLLSEIQKQGAIPDTNSLASAIAGYLQTHLSQSESKSPSASSNFADGHPQGFQGQFNSMQNQEQGNFSPQNINPAMMNFAAQLPNLNIPMQLQGQTITMPMSPQQQYGGGLVPGYPLQVQLQTDPRTGFIQLVPVGPMGPPPSIYSQGNMDENSDSRSVHSSKSPKPSSADNSAILNTSFSSSKSRGRTARDLVQKTANIRNRNVTPGANAPKMDSDTSLWRSKSAHALDQTGKLDSSHGMEFNIKRQVYDDTAIQMNRGTANGVYNLHPPKQFNQRADNMVNVARQGNGYQYYMNPPRTRSQSSSPSPSKDSGVSGMNTGYKPPPPGSLMERLLNSNASLKQQQRLGLVVHLLREEFAFDGYMENGVEDLAMAEYIGSLGNLKWETFASAITEKYSDLYWSSELLCNLYEAVNGAKPEGNPRLQASKKPKETDNMSMRTEDMEVKLPGLEDQNLSSSSMSDKSGQQPVRKRGHDDITHQSSAMKQSERMAGHLSQGKQMESSDSDQDNFERRRRYRRKYQERASKAASGSHLQNLNSTYTVSSADNRSLEIPPRIHQVQRIDGDKVPIEDGGVIPANDIRDSWQGNSLTQANHFSDPNSLVNVNEISSAQQGHIDSPTTLPIQRQNAWGEGSSQRDTPPSPHVMSLDRQNKRESPRGTSRQVSLSNLIPESQQKNSQSHFTPQKPPRGMLVHKNSDSRGSHPQLNNAVAQGQKQVNLARAGSGSSQSSSVGGTVVTRHLSQASLTDQVTLRPDVSGIKKRRCHILYHGATIHLNISPEIEKFMQDIDEDNPEYLSIQLASIQQQLAMERKQRRKSQNFYNKLQDTPRPTKGEQKNTVTQVSKDLDEMTQKVRFLDLCRSHIEMLQAELHGIHCSYLNSIATCPRGQPLILKPCQDNPLLQFQVFREPQSGCDLLTLQAGTPEGLMSHLFAYTALSDGYMHQFLFCFRYFVKPVQVLSFLINIYKSAAQLSGSKDTNRTRIQQRVLDVIHLWLEGFYSVDFECNHEVIELLHAFLQLNEIKSLKEGQDLLELLTNCEEGHSVDLISVKAEEDVHIYKAAAPKKWGSLKSLFRGKSSSPKPLSVCAGDRTGPMKANHDDVYFPKTARRTDAFALADYTPQCLAEQLTLIAQSIFHLTHPVHYLNSKAHGVSVALTMPGNKGFQRQMSSQEESTQSLFVGGDIQDNPIQTLIDHTQEVSYWTAAEIVGCGSSKGQVAVLSKFLYTAQICKEMRNYGTCLAIMDGLENLIVKQLPAWKHLPTKCLAIVEELNAVRMFLKNDDMSALSTSDSHLLPTIPPVLLFLLHVQQQEIGSFQLANGMFKWIKMRSITKVIDQIRIFKDHVYGFDPDFDLQETLHMRIQELSRQDLHVIASQHDSNFQKIPSAGGIGAAFRKMKGKLQNK